MNDLTPIQRITGLLGAALIQSTDKDDPIIMGCVREAHELAKEAAQKEHRDHLHSILGAVLEPEHVSGRE